MAAIAQTERSAMLVVSDIGFTAGDTFRQIETLAATVRATLATSPVNATVLLQLIEELASNGLDNLITRARSVGVNVEDQSQAVH